MKKQMTKQWILSVLMGVVLLLAACAPAAAPVAPGAATEAAPAEAGAVPAAAGEKITVIFPRHEADISGAFEKRIRDFTKETGIEVELIQSDWDSVAAKILPEMATGGSAYDVVEFDNGWIAQWCGANWVAPLDDLMPAGFTDGMIPGLVKLFSCPDGTVRGAVWNNDTRFFYYNKAKLEEAGLSAPPATLDELKQQSLAAQKAGVVKHGLAQPWKQEWALGNEFHFWTYVFGGKIVDEKGCFLFNKDPNTLAALQFMVDSLSDGVTNPASLTYDQAAAQNLFLSGETLFMAQGIAGLMAYANNPEISKVKDQVAVSIVPGAEAGKSATLTLPEAYAIPSASQHKEAAAKFIQYMTSQETNKVLAQEIGLLPIWVDLYTDPDLVKLYPFWAQFADQLATAQGLSTVTWYGDFVDAATSEISAALGNQKSAQQALDDTAAALKQFDCVP